MNEINLMLLEHMVLPLAMLFLPDVSSNAANVPNFSFFNSVIKKGVVERRTQLQINQVLITFMNQLTL